jgi:hypothetical protein
MDNLELYQEENREQLIELNKGVSNLSKLIQTQNNGLILTTVGNGLDATIVYE